MKADLWRILERIGLARRRIGDGDLPSGGRSSVPSYRGFSGQVAAMVNDYITPAVPFELMELIERAAVYNPDISQAVRNWRNMANTGHSLVLEGPDSRVERATEILNEAAYRIYQRSAGLDGLVNHLLDQVAVSGAVCAEAVVAPDLSEIQEVALVPVHTIRFRYQDGRLVPYQKISGFDMARDLVPLNETTWSMYALQVFRDSPYPKPPMSAVLEPLISQRASWQNIEFIVRKIGLLGLVDVALNIPTQKPGETEQAYEVRKKAFLDQAVTAFAGNFRQGLMVHYKDFEIEHHNITGDARGAADMFQVIEEQVASGIGTDPALLGRSYSTTETYAGVVFGILVKDCQNSQRLVKRMIERTYRLELILHGIEVDSLSIKFNQTPARDPLAEAQAEETRIRTIVSKAEKGMVDPDQAAQEAGYEEWYDPELIQQSSGLSFPFSKPRNQSQSRSFRFDQSGQRYRFTRPRIMVRLASKDQEAEKAFAKALRDYLDAVKPHVDSARRRAVESALQMLETYNVSDFADADDFAGTVFKEIRPEYAGVLGSTEFRAEVAAAVSPIYRLFKTADLSAWAKDPPILFEIGGWDRRTIAWTSDIDNFFYSKFIDNKTMAEPVQNFLRDEFMEKGEGLFGRTAPETVEKFRDLFDDRLSELGDHQVSNILNHSVQRQRNWAHGQQMREAGIVYAEVVAVLDDRTSDICREMHGKRIPVGPAMEGLDKVLDLSPDGFLEHLESIDSEEYIQPENMDEMVRNGFGWPPYHPGPCRSRVIAVVE